MASACLRYGPPYYKTHLGPGRYDWDFTDEVFAELKRLGIMPIVDLCHFGVPDWIGDFQNPDFPALFAEYAEAFARRFPWVSCTRRSTRCTSRPIFQHASACGTNAWHPTQPSSPPLKHLVKANVLAMRSDPERPAGRHFIQSESSEYFHAAEPAAIKLGRIT